MVKYSYRAYSSMKQINKLRTSLILSEYEDGNCSMEITDVLQRFLKNCPSTIERGQCKRKGCKSINHDFNVPVLGMDHFEFNDSLKNLVPAVMSNFPDTNLCRKCRHPYESFVRISGHHLFIEVIFTFFGMFQIILIKLISFFSFQMLKSKQILIINPEQLLR